MSRCACYEPGKYGLNPKKKQCLNVATKKAVMPLTTWQDALEKGATTIAYAWICAFHATMLQTAKSDLIREWRRREVQAKALLN